MIGGSALHRWIYAVKLKSWAKLLVPMALGQGVGVAIAGRFDGTGLWLAAGFTVFDLLFIVLLNDWADEAVDRTKRHLFPEGCSPKTIPDGILSARQVLWAGVLSGAGAIAFATVGGLLYARPALGLFASGCIALFVMYSLPPVRLNYRGGGELLEMIGVGIALPWFSAYAQAAVLFPAQLTPVLCGFALLSLSSAIASGLADEESDRVGGKRTIVTLLGNLRGRRAVEGTAFLGAISWMILGRKEGPEFGLWVGALIATVHLVGVWSKSSSASTNAFAAQRRYKAWLHRGISLAGLTVGWIYGVDGLQ